ncbi:sensor histidine kinase [Pseudonocardia humida]|uniref:Sensor histidine kinase n=1 Tax=Pseudonocardia humida TaxID=2800819 RepID=A0ABT0ZYK8_9PSEU|nr:sensor histidine kinase [Pseudonocardia humida]MCO1655832.1 sensor histidine kinase [Pseudonocardia humida]
MTGPAEQLRRPTTRWGAAALRAWWDGSPKRWSPTTFFTLFWTVTLLYVPLFDPTPQPVVFVIGALAMAVYVPFYLAVDLRPGPLREYGEWLTTGLALLVTPFNPGGAILLVYAGGIAGNHRSRRVAMRWLVALTALVAAFFALSPIPLPWRFWAFGPSAVLIWVIGLICIEANAEGRATSIRNAQVEHLATVAERERISRDLHDLLGHTLTGIVVRSQLAQRLVAADPDAGVAEMAAVEKAAREALTEVRATVSGWRQVDFGAELEAAREALTAAGVELASTRDPDLVLTPSAESALGLALREAVTNVVRHAGATRCVVSLRGEGGEVSLEVTDDGVGGGRDGNGLTGMRERIAALGGEVRRSLHGGTALLVTLPRSVAT